MARSHLRQALHGSTARSYHRWRCRQDGKDHLQDDIISDSRPGATSSPLRYDDRTIGGMIALRAGQVLIITPFVLAGQ